MPAHYKSHCGREFEPKNFGLHHDQHEIFITPQCGPFKIYPVWTVVAMLYHVVALIYDAAKTSDAVGGTTANYFLYIHNWSYLLLTVYAIFDCISTLYVHCYRKHLLKRHEVNHNEIGIIMRDKEVKFSYKTIGEIYSIQWYMKVSWVLFTMSSVVGIMVTYIYWILYAVVYDFDSLTFYLINTIMILLHVLISAKPLRLLHFYMPLTFVTVYLIFMAIYYGDTHDNIYSAYDWDDAFFTAAKTIGVVYFLVPFVHIQVYLLVQLRTVIGRWCHMKYTVSRWKKVNRIQVIQNTAF